MTAKKREPGTPGREKLLDIDDRRTLATIRGLGKIQATTRECAAVLGVSHQTFITFSNENALVGELLEAGKAIGKTSLRRKQFAEAMKGNTTMLVWLGKQYLDQKDKHEVAQTVDVTVTDARSKLEHLLDRHAATGSESGASRSTH